MFIALLIFFAAFLLIHGNYITMYYKAGSDISAGEVKVTFDKEGVAEVRDIRVKDRLVRGFRKNRGVNLYAAAQRQWSSDN